MQQGYRPPQNPQPRQPVYNAPQGYQPQHQPQYQAQYQQQTVNVNINAPIMSRESFFDGGVLSWIGLSIVNFFIVFFTMGFGLPWAYCRTRRWEQQHTVIDGHRLVFDGTAAGMFGLWIKIWFLCLITAGIYGFWARISVKKWVTRHSHLV